MQCKKCNAFIPEGYMYCPVCGEEIIIVSDFEIKLEDNIDMTAIASTIELPDVNKELKEIDNKLNNEVHLDESKPMNPRWWILIIAIGVFVIAGCIIAAINISRYLSFDYQYKKGIEEAAADDFTGAIKTLRHANSLDDANNDGRKLLADCYMHESNYDAAIAVLYEALKEDNEDLEITDRIVKCYEMQGDSRGIHELIENYGDGNIALRYSDYISIAPKFSLESGSYVSPDPIKLSAPGNGTIYYTTDGSEPTVESLEYLGPIPLDTGHNTISAIYLNEKGIISEVVTNNYEVILNTPNTPELVVPSGNLSKPELITIEYSEGDKLYYTTDGKDPTDDSNLYTSPLLMPLGRSKYSFCAYNDEGLSSKIIVGTYNLDINDNIDTATAEYAISYQLTLMGENVLLNTYKAKYGYSKDNHTYYVIEECTGNNVTGRLFAVDTNSGALFTFNKSTYNLSPL